MDNLKGKDEDMEADEIANDAMQVDLRQS